MKGKPTLTTTSRSPRVKPAPRAKAGMVPPAGSEMPEQPTRTQVIERMVGGTLEAQIERILHRDGLECRFVMPLDKLRPDVRGEPIG